MEKQVNKQNTDKPDYHVVSFSGGKDSTAMLLRMIEEDMPIDCILFCDTGVEFPQMYEHIEKVEKYIGREITVVRGEKSFEDYLLRTKLKEPPESGKHDSYGFPYMMSRWCTTFLKDRPRVAFIKKCKEKYNVIEYIGLACDEEYRLKRKSNKGNNQRHPLVDWQMTEADCLQYCYDRGFDWGGLYKERDNVSCWCCPMSPLPELKLLCKEHPGLWQKLKYWESQTWNTFKYNYTLEQLEKRFDFEDKWQAEGKGSMRTKQFYKEVKEAMGVEKL